MTKEELRSNLRPWTEADRINDEEALTPIFWFLEKFLSVVGEDGLLAVGYGLAKGPELGVMIVITVPQDRLEELQWLHMMVYETPHGVAPIYVRVKPKIVRS